MGIYSIDGVIPVVHHSAFVHPEAVLIGDVIVGPNCYIAPCAVLRGDYGRIEVRAGANVQDTCVMHPFPGQDCTVEEDGHIGHGVILHGCVVKKGALVGMGAILLDGCVIGERAFVGAHSLVPAGFHVPDEVLVVGAPARVVRGLSQQDMAWKANGTQVYQELAVRSNKTMHLVEPLTEVEANRPRVSTGRDVATPLHELLKIASESIND